MKRHYLQALLTIVLIATMAVLQLRHAFDEGRDCRQRGGVTCTPPNPAYITVTSRS